GRLFGSGWKGLSALLKTMITRACPQPAVTLFGAPDGVELAIHQKHSAYVAQLLDWGKKRTINNAKLTVNLPGKWKAFNPALGKQLGTVSQGEMVSVAPFKVHTMIVLKSTEQQQ